MEPEVVKSLMQVHTVGKKIPSNYVSETFDKGTVPITNTIPRNKIKTFENRPISSLKK